MSRIAQLIAISLFCQQIQAAPAVITRVHTAAAVTVTEGHPAEAATTNGASPTTQDAAPTTPAATTGEVETTSPTEQPQPTTSETSTETTSTPETTSETSSGSTSTSDLSDFESDILKAHNEKRSLHGVQHLQWNSTLAEFAANYASKSFSCDNVQLIHSKGPYGENLAAGYSGGTSPVEAWYDEIKSYNFNNPGFNEATGHFTQLIWKASTQVGCAKVDCNNSWKQYTICEYSNSRGNVVGTDSATGKSYFAENVVRPLSS